MHALTRLPVLLVALAVAWVSLAVLEPVSAQETDTVTISVAATPDPGDQQISLLVTNDATSTPLDPGMVLALVLVLLLLALFALSEIFRYLREGRVDYYNTFREFARKGVYVAPVMVNATAAQPAAALVQADGTVRESAQSPALFRVSGPGMIAANEAGMFKAFLDDSPADDTRWVLTTPDGAAVPAQNATVEPPTGATTTFTAAKPGIYRLTATPATALNLNLLVETTINVVEPPIADGIVPKLPFIGEGYGSIVGAILLLAVVVVLAATRAIDADIIGVLLGSIAGYLFGVGISKGTS